MSSGFVSGGTTEEPTQRDEEWLKAQQDLEEERRRKAEVGKQNEGKSLYEVLQQNKTAKQEAFEESIRLKNQFRSLDEDEVEFLDSVLESTRAKEAALKKETAEQLEVFRRQRQEVEKTGPSADADAAQPEEEQWAVSGKKRRRAKDKEPIKGFKKRKSSSGGAAPAPAPAPSQAQAPAPASEAQSAKNASKPTPIEKTVSKSDPCQQQMKPADKASTDESKTVRNKDSPPRQSEKPPPVAVTGSLALGLGAYSSDED